MKQQANPHFAAYYRRLVINQVLGARIQADSILDVGCDDGYLLSDQEGELKIGLDLAPRVLPDEDLSVVQADGLALPFADRSMSCILAFDIIEHIEDDNAFIASLTRVLGPGGRLWLSTPTETSFLFPAFLTRRLIRRWGHQRVGYNVDDLVNRFPPDYKVEVTLWNARSFRFLYLPLWALSRFSSQAARLGAQVCFEMDRLLAQGQDHIFLKVTGGESPVDKESHT